MTESAHAVVSAIAGTFQSTTGNGNHESSSAKRLVHGEEVAGITASTVLVSYTALVARARCNEQSNRALRRRAKPPTARRLPGVLVQHRGFDKIRPNSIEESGIIRRNK